MRSMNRGFGSWRRIVLVAAVVAGGGAAAGVGVNAAASAAGRASPTHKAGKRTMMYRNHRYYASHPEKTRLTKRGQRLVRQAHPRASVRPSATSPAIATGIHADHFNHLPGMPNGLDVENSWIGRIAGKYYMLCAGGQARRLTANAPRPAAQVLLYRIPVQNGVAGMPQEIGDYRAPGSAKRVRITDQRNGTVALKSNDGTVLRFDVSTRRFV